ncbi:MAG: hypothetical protein ACRDVD_02700 [Acidimicrobiia bacterium]
MSDDLTEVSRRLCEALVEAYPAHVRGRLGEDEIPGLDQAVADGREWLAGALYDLLRQPFPEQRRGPLEIFQEAMRFPTAHLAETERPPARRDPIAISALPGDVYDLAPASTRDLGEDVWMLHLAWGAAKAAAVTRPPRSAQPDDDR